MTTLKTSKIQFQGFYSKYSYKQFSEGGKEILYSGDMISTSDLFNNYGMRMSPDNSYKFCIIYRIKSN